MAVVHWNTRSFHTKHHEIHSIIHDFNAQVLCFQESYHTSEKPVFLRHFAAYNVASPSATFRPCGGVSTLVSNKIPHRQIPLATSLQAVAINVTLHRSITVCNLYLPPSQSVPYNLLSNLVSQLPTPFILLGDFNAHSTIWGNNSNDARGDDVEKLISDFNLCLLNDKTHTFVHSGLGTTSSIDLTICSPSLYLDFQWQVADDLYSSDHFPIILNSITPTVEPHLPRYN